MMEAVLADHADAAKVLIDAKVSVTTKHASGNTPLSCASKRGHAATPKALAATVGANSDTALMLAALVGYRQRDEESC